MSFELIQRNMSASRQLKDTDGIALQKDTFTFYENFLKRANIMDASYVQFWIDYETKRIAIRLVDKKAADSYKVASPTKRTTRHRNIAAKQVARLASEKLGYRRHILYKPKLQKIMDVDMWVISNDDPDNHAHGQYRS